MPAGQRTQALTHLEGWDLERIPDVRLKAGIPADTDFFSLARDGFMVLDTVSGVIWARLGGVWLAESRLRLVSVAAVAFDLNAANGIAAWTELELTGIPANDPYVVAANVSLMIRDSVGTANNFLQVGHRDTSTEAGITYTTGVTGRGGMAGPAFVRVGGTNGRSIYWQTNTAGNTAQSFIRCNGYWTGRLF
jgi:hypothetical protein